jgi:peptide/nickel transport system ATP-binding protein
MSIIFVTHNLGVVAQMCDEVAVMYLGRIVERASVLELFDNPKHPYTRALMRSIPQLGSRQKGRLAVIEGSVPGAYSQVAGCPFHPRCPVAMPGVCEVHVPRLLPVAGGESAVACFLHHNPDGTPAQSADGVAAASPAAAVAASPALAGGAGFAPAIHSAQSAAGEQAAGVAS